MMIVISTITMRITEVNPEAIDLTDAKILVNFSEIKIHVVEVNAVKTRPKANIRVTATKVIITKAIMVFIITHVETQGNNYQGNHSLYHNPRRNYQQGNHFGQFRSRSHGHGRGNFCRCSHGRSNY